MVEIYPLSSNTTTASNSEIRNLIGTVVDSGQNCSELILNHVQDNKLITDSNQLQGQSIKTESVLWKEGTSPPLVTFVISVSLVAVYHLKALNKSKIRNCWFSDMSNEKSVNTKNLKRKLGTLLCSWWSGGHGFQEHGAPSFVQTTET